MVFTGGFISCLRNIPGRNLDHTAVAWTLHLHVCEGQSVSGGSYESNLSSHGSTACPPVAAAQETDHSTVTSATSPTHCSLPETLEQRNGCQIASQKIHDTCHTFSTSGDTHMLKNTLTHISTLRRHHSHFPQGHQYEGRLSHECRG